MVTSVPGHFGLDKVKHDSKINWDRDVWDQTVKLNFKVETGIFRDRQSNFLSESKIGIVTFRARQSDTYVILYIVGSGTFWTRQNIT